MPTVLVNLMDLLALENQILFKSKQPEIEKDEMEAEFELIMMEKLFQKELENLDEYWIRIPTNDWMVASLSSWL